MATHNTPKSLSPEEITTLINQSGYPLWVYDAYYANQFLNGEMSQLFNETQDTDHFDDQEPYGI